MRGWELVWVEDCGTAGVALEAKGITSAWSIDAEAEPAQECTCCTEAYGVDGSDAAPVIWAKF